MSQPIFNNNNNADGVGLSAYLNPSSIRGDNVDADGVNLQVEFNPLTPHITSNEKREAIKQKLSLQTRDSNGGHLKYRLEGSKEENVKNRFLDVRDIVLNCAIKKQQISPNELDTIMDFKISFDRRIATFTHPISKDKITIDLMNLQEAQEEVNKFFVEADEIIHFSRNQSGQYSKESKGRVDTAAEKPFRRTTEDLQKLRKDHKQAAKTMLPQLVLEAKEIDRKVLVDRAIFVQHNHQMMIRGLDTLIAKKKQEHKELLQRSDADQSKVETLASDVRIMSQRRKALDDLDVDLLIKALAHFPVGAYTQVELDHIVQVFINSLKKELRVDEKANATSFFRAEAATKKRQAAKKENTFAEEAGGIFYRNRWEYMEYCEKHNLPIKQETIEDVFFREAVSFAENQSTYNSNGFIYSSLFKDLSTDLKTELTKRMDIVTEDVKKGFPVCPEDQFKIEMTLPPNASTEMQKNIEEIRKRTKFSCMENKISEYRKKAFGNEESTSVLQLQGKNPGIEEEEASLKDNRKQNRNNNNQMPSNGSQDGSSPVPSTSNQNGSNP